MERNLFSATRMSLLSSPRRARSFQRNVGSLHYSYPVFYCLTFDKIGMEILHNDYSKAVGLPFLSLNSFLKDIYKKTVDH